MTTQINAEKCHVFVCEKCDFKSSKESNYKLHLDTIKHKRLHETTKKMPNMDKQKFNCMCGNKYNHHSSLAKHKRTCIAVNTSVSFTLEENKAVTANIEDVVCCDNKVIITFVLFKIN